MDRVLILMVLLSTALAAAQVSVTARRLSDTPVLKPGAQPWMSAGVFNPAAAFVDGRTVLLFRAQDAHGTSRIGYAESTDGLHFTITPEPVLSPETGYEKDGGVEDPRLLRIGDLWYLTYTGYNTRDAQLCLATSKDLKHWDRKGVILPAYKGSWNEKWTKSGAIVPQQIDGKWWMYYLGTKRDPDGQERDYMGLANSTDLLHWSDATSKPVLDRRPGAFDSRVMEPGPPPIVTDAGILLLYNGADDKLVYGPGWALFDAKDPRRVLSRADKPFILPKLEWERVGQVPNVIFLEGTVMKSFWRLPYQAFMLFGYYGGADKFTGAMRIDIRVQ
jgi:predicted GH43/DUF377 family glycosyl hydrolase